MSEYTDEIKRQADRRRDVVYGHIAKALLEGRRITLRQVSEAARVNFYTTRGCVRWLVERGYLIRQGKRDELLSLPSVR